jgi:hypothetical protein
MKSLYSVLVACLLVVPILFVSSIKGETLNGNITGGKMKEIKKEAEKTAKNARIQLKQAVLSGQRKQIAIASRILESATVNSAVADDLLKNVQADEAVKMQYAKNCRNISYELTIALGSFLTEQGRRGVNSLARAEKIAADQPRPKDAEKTSSEINAAKVSVLKFAETKKVKDSSLSMADIARDVLKIDNAGESEN